MVQRGEKPKKIMGKLNQCDVSPTQQAATHAAERVQNQKGKTQPMRWKAAANTDRTPAATNNCLSID